MCVCVCFVAIAIDFKIIETVSQPPLPKWAFGLYNVNQNFDYFVLVRIIATVSISHDEMNIAHFQCSATFLSQCLCFLTQLITCKNWIQIAQHRCKLKERRKKRIYHLFSMVVAAFRIQYSERDRVWFLCIMPSLFSAFISFAFLIASFFPLENKWQRTFNSHHLNQTTFIVIVYILCSIAFWK